MDIRESENIVIGFIRKFLVPHQITFNDPAGKN